MGDKPRHREQSSLAVTPMYFSPQHTCIQILHLLHVEMALLSSPVGMLTSANHILFNKASALLSTWWKTAASGQGFGSTPAGVAIPRAAAPSSLSHPPTRARQTAGCWSGVEVSSNQKWQFLHFFFVMWSNHALPHLPCAALPAPSPQSQPPHKAGKQKPPSTQQTLYVEYLFTSVFPRVSGLNGMFWAV